MFVKMVNFKEGGILHQIQNSKAPHFLLT